MSSLKGWIGLLSSIRLAALEFRDITDWNTTYWTAVLSYAVKQEFAITFWIHSLNQILSLHKIESSLLLLDRDVLDIIDVSLYIRHLAQEVWIYSFNLKIIY